VQEVGETLQGFTVPKLRRESIFKNTGETKDTGFAEKQRLRSLISRILPRFRKK
jgi:hypothetical protein